MQTYFSSDFHLGHKAITKYRTQFSSMEEHDEAILTMLESFPKRTLMHILGDFLFDGPNLNYYRYFNVNLDNNYFKPVPLEEIVEYSKKLHP